MIAENDLLNRPGDEARTAVDRFRRCETRSSTMRMCSAGEAGIAIEQTETTLGANLVSDGEIVLLSLRPSLLYVPLASAGALAVIGLLTFALAYLSRLPWTGWTDTYAFAFGLGAATVRLAWQMLEWYSRVYVLTDRRVIRRRGVLRVNVFETRLGNIQHTNVMATVRERAFGLGTIGFSTAGSDTFDALWLMVRQPFRVHSTVVEAIRRYGRRPDH